jgi:hypothetical protein
VRERSNIIDETFDEIIDDKTYWYFLSVSAEMDDEAGTIEVEIRLAWDQHDKDLAHVKVQTRITNPLEIVAAYLLHAAAHYGLCIGASLIHSGGALCFESYKESSDQIAKMSVGNRCRDVFRRLKGKSSQAKKDAKQALTACIVHAGTAAAVPIP